MNPIVAPALRKASSGVTVGTLAAGHRALVSEAEEAGERGFFLGFVDSEGAYHNRIESAKIAIAMNQITKVADKFQGLTCEDLIPPPRYSAGS